MRRNAREAVMTATEVFERSLLERVSDTPWGQFSQSDYTNAQWKAACLIHLDPAAGQDPLVKSLHKVAVKEPNGTLNRNGCHAAASVLAGGRGGVDAPADKKKAAAKTLVGYYKNQLNETPPDSLVNLANGANSAEPVGAVRAVTVGQLEPADHVVRTDLLRMAPFTLERAGDAARVGAGQLLEGHAAVFNQKTVIDSWEGRFTETIAPGAFKKTFRDMRPVIQFDHGRHPLIGSIPLGRFIDGTPKEDDLGAFVRAELANNWLIQPIRDAIDNGSVSGMSFRFEVLREEWRDKDGKLITNDMDLMEMLWDDSKWPERTLIELRVPELGPVVFPAYTGTDVSVRTSEDGTAVINLRTLSENPEERVSLARSLFLAERATLGHKSDDSTPRDAAPAEDPDEGTPVEPPARDEDHQSAEAVERTSELAESMRARLESLRR